jgi:hypothetical protein
VTGVAAVVDKAVAVDVSSDAIKMDTTSCKAVAFCDAGTARSTAHKVSCRGVAARSARLMPSMLLAHSLTPPPPCAQITLAYMI